MCVALLVHSAESEEFKNTHFHYKFSHMQIQLLFQIFVRTMTLPETGKSQTQKLAKENEWKLSNKNPPILPFSVHTVSSVN